MLNLLFLLMLPIDVEMHWNNGTNGAPLTQLVHQHYNNPKPPHPDDDILYVDFSVKVSDPDGWFYMVMLKLHGAPDTDWYQLFTTWPYIPGPANQWIRIQESYLVLHDNYYWDVKIVVNTANSPLGTTWELSRSNPPLHCDFGE